MGPDFEVRAREVHSDMGGVQCWETEKTMWGGSWEIRLKE